MGESEPDGDEEAASTRPARKLTIAVRFSLYLVVVVLLVRVLAPDKPSTNEGDPDGEVVWLIGSTTALLVAVFFVGLMALIVEAALRLARRGSTR